MFDVGDRVMLEAPVWAPAPTKLGRVIAVRPYFSVNLGKHMDLIDVEWDDGTIDKGYGRETSLLKKISVTGHVG